jgi:hypothetical protein
MHISDLISKNILVAEIADTPSKCEMGLMFRKELKENAGMIFMFKYPQKLKFWGVNTYLPLDIAFVSDENIITKISHISPMSSRVVESDDECRIAIESNYGYFKDNKINEGDKIKVNKDEEEVKIEFSARENIKKSETFIFVDNKMQKVAYTTKDHSVRYAKPKNGDGCQGVIELTEGKDNVIIEAIFTTGIYKVALFEEQWLYPKEEIKRAIKTFNKVVNVLEDMKIEAEDSQLPTPSIQGFAREQLRYIDVDRKKPTNNRSLEAAKYLDGVSDWRDSLYGGRYPTSVVNLNNYGHIYITEKESTDNIIRE